jgi:hypothetical protein
MLIRTTTDPITLRDVPDPYVHPSLLDGDARNGLEIYFESERNRQEFLSLKPHDPKVLLGSDAEDYVAEG